MVHFPFPSKPQCPFPSTCITIAGPIMILTNRRWYWWWFDEDSNGDKGQVATKVVLMTASSTNWDIAETNIVAGWFRYSCWNEKNRPPLEIRDSMQSPKFIVGCQSLVNERLRVVWVGALPCVLSRFDLSSNGFFPLERNRNGAENKVQKTKGRN